MIGVIGAGIAGLICAQTLSRAGHPVTVIDKGRGLGGRIATRRTEFGSFDHGAQYLRARQPSLVTYLEQLAQSRSAAVWEDASEDTVRYVGTPGMSDLVKPLARGLDVKLSTEVVELNRMPSGWILLTAEGHRLGPFGSLVLTAPTPQIRNLIAPWAAAFPELSVAQYSPCWTMMVAFPNSLEAPSFERNKGEFGSIVQNSSKPGRSTDYENWVAQASPEWSLSNLERDREDVASDLLARFFETMGVSPAEPSYLAAHRWRYALVERAVGTPFLYAPDLRIGIAGDGMLGGRIDAAYESGIALGYHLR